MYSLINKFHYQTSLGSFLRLPLKLLPKSLVLPVLSGPSRGSKWVTGAGPNGAWLGTLERDKLEHFIRRLRGGFTVWDIGANVGLYTVPSAKAVGCEGRVYAFEPIMQNLAYLKQHISLNLLSNVVVIPAAVVAHTGRLQMSEGDSPSEFFADSNGTFEVSAIALDDWREEFKIAPPHIVKIDVEGAETEVLRGGHQTFSRYRPTIYLALHGESQRQKCGSLLRGWGYQLSSLEVGTDITVSSEWLAEAS